MLCALPGRGGERKLPALPDDLANASYPTSCGPSRSAQYGRSAPRRVVRELVAFARFGSLVMVWRELRKQLPNVRRNERLLQDRSADAAQEAVRRGAQSIRCDKGGARAQMRASLDHPV